MKMKEKSFIPNVRIIKKGQVGSNLYFLYNGEVVMQTFNSLILSVRKNSFGFD